MAKGIKWLRLPPPPRTTSRARSRSPKRAIFLDRDGVINDLEYNAEEGHIGAPLSSKQLRVHPYSGTAVRKLRALGFLTILVSNQPGVAKKQLTYAEFLRMNVAVRKQLSVDGGQLDGEYYCLHHPDAVLPKYRVECDCRKPKPGLLLRAAEENDVSLPDSYLVGDALADVKAGKAAGCKTILLAHMTAFLARMIEVEDAEPDYVVHSLKEVPALIERLS
jgi:D,D-heptose 1,7-bisphosphate phosphatase